MFNTGADLGGGCRGYAPPLPEMTCSFLMQLVFCKKKLWFIGVEVEQETSAPPPKKILDPPLQYKADQEHRFKKFPFHEKDSLHRWWGSFGQCFRCKNVPETKTKKKKSSKVHFIWEIW